MEVEKETDIESSEEKTHTGALNFLEESNKENQMETQLEETQDKENEVQQIVCKPRHLDTDTLIKGEIKQLIVTEISEATSARTLNDMACEVEKEINTLKEKRNQLLHKNKSLSEQIEIDNIRLQQSKDILSEADEMIALLKEKFEKLQKLLKESHVHEILTKTEKQYSNLESLKSVYAVHLEEKNEKIKKEFNTNLERNKILKAELKCKEKLLEDARKKQSDMRIINKFYNEEISKCLFKKEVLQAKLEKRNQQSGHSVLDNENYKQDNMILQKMYLTKENHIKKFNKMIEEKAHLKQSLEADDQEITVLKEALNNLHQELLQKETDFERFRKQFEKIRIDNEASLQKLQQNHKNIVNQLDEHRRNVFSLTQIDSTKHKVLNVLHGDYVNKCEEKLKRNDKILEKQTTLHDFSLMLANKQSEWELNQNKYEELQIKYKSLLMSYKSVEDENFQEQSRLSKELSELTKKYEVAKSEQEKYIQEMMEQKNNALSTMIFLKEKSQKLVHEIEHTESTYENLKESNESVINAIKRQQNSLSELKRKLETKKQKKSEDILSKTSVKLLDKENIRKKVQFNEILSIKSPTESSDNSSQTAFEAKTQLEKSFSEWLDANKQT